MAITKATSSSVAPAAKGDLVVGSATNDSGVLSVGANDTVLTADSSTATGLKWGTVSAGSNWTLLNTGGTALTGASTITISGISGKDKIMALVYYASAGAASEIDFRLNGDSSSIYSGYGSMFIGKSSYNWDVFGYYGNELISVANFARISGDGADYVMGGITFTGCNSSGSKAWQVTGASRSYNGQNGLSYNGQGIYTGTSTISSISILSSVGNFDNGTIYIYTSA